MMRADANQVARATMLARARMAARASTTTRTAMASAIDVTQPPYGDPTTLAVRQNFEAAKTEIEALQTEKLSLTGGTMTGPIVLAATQILDGGTF
jgi:hypothetical protein